MSDVLDPLLIEFTARCECGTDATHTSELTYSPAGMARHPRLHVDCPSCGPCPCDYCEVRGVAA